jgi:hypothetical protein
MAEGGGVARDVGGGTADNQELWKPEHISATMQYVVAEQVDVMSVFASQNEELKAVHEKHRAGGADDNLATLGGAHAGRLPVGCRSRRAGQRCRRGGSGGAA